MARTTAHRCRLTAAAAFIALLALMPAAVAAQRPTAPFRITALKAMLFYGQTGTFSPDLFGPAAPILQNVTTGEGQATATLVVVEVQGRPDAYAPARKLVFTATAARRLLLTKTVAIGRPGADGKFYVALWLYDTGCTPVLLKAQITGQAQAATLQKTLDFKCGD